MQYGYQRIIAAGAAFLWLVAGAQAACAQASDADEGPTRARLANDLFKSVQLDMLPERIGDALFGVLQKDGYNCDWVSEYQIFAATRRQITFKVKCPGVPLYAIEVTADQQLTIFGGNNLIIPFAFEDGPIIGLSLPLQQQDPAEAFRAEAAGPDSGLASPANGSGLAQQRREAEVLNAPALSPWIVLSVIINVMLVIGLLIGFFMVSALRRDRALSAQGLINGPLTSSEKDDLVGASTEVMPLIYSHPSGLIIVKGRRGKRRLFPSLPLAILYRRTGIKLLEIR